MRFLSIAAMTLGLVAGPVLADGHATGDAEAGKDGFRKCKACHSVTDAGGEVIEKGGKIGPNLYGILDRVAGTEEDFASKYGDGLQAAGEAGLTWNETDFVAYVADPVKFLRGYLDNSRARSKMTFKLPSAEDAADIWAYLVSVGPEAKTN